MAHSVFTRGRKKITDSSKRYPWMTKQLCQFHQKPLAEHTELRIVATYDEDGNHKTFDVLNCEMLKEKE